MYDTEKEITQKLQSSIILYDNKPVRVLEGCKIGKSLGVQIIPCNSGVVSLVPLDDPMLDFRSIGSRLGYIFLSSYNNYKNVVTYMMRVPVRKVEGTQGLCPWNVKMTPFPIPGELFTPEFGAWIYETNYKHFCAMLDGKYPTLSQLKSFFANKGDANVLGKNWAIMADPVGPFKLLYKNTQVGYSEDLEKFVIPDRYSLLVDEFNQLREEKNAA